MQYNPLMVHTRMLYFIEENADRLSEVGLLMPPFRAKVNPYMGRKELQMVLSSGEYREKLKYSILWHIRRSSIFLFLDDNVVKHYMIIEKLK
jgi:hypothetical protein